MHQELYLRNNELDHLPPDVFSNMPKLSQLGLSGNRLKTVDGNIFSHMPGWMTSHVFLVKTNSLIKAGCVLTDLLYCFPSELKKLYLHDNPWQCNCKIISLVSWMGQTKTTLSPRDALKCIGPPHLRNKSLGSLQADKLICET